MSATTRIRTFVIHLARAKARRPAVDALLAEAPFPAEILDAVDGRSLSDWPLAPRFRPAYPFEMGGGEVGCFLSHRAAWQRIADSGLEAGLVLEDDVALGDGFAETAAFAAEHIRQLGFIQFQTRPLPEPYRVQATRGNLQIVTPRVVPLRLSAQLIHRDAARRLLDVTETFDRPVDTTLQMVWETKVPIHVALPSCVSDRTAEVGGTTIQGGSKRGLWENLVRGLRRHRYRSAIRRLSE